MLTEVQTGADAIELAVVVPCFNERENVSILVEKLTAVLDGIVWEVIFVDDDSPDGTARRGTRACCLQSAGALPPADRAARFVECSDRGHAGNQRAIPRRDGRGPATRRTPIARDVESA